MLRGGGDTLISIFRGRHIGRCLLLEATGQFTMQIPVKVSLQRRECVAPSFCKRLLFFFEPKDFRRRGRRI